MSEATHFLDGRVTLHAGDAREVLRGQPDASLDACVTDPPYALVSIGKRFGKEGAAPAKSDGATGVYARASAGFMGQAWDTGETAFDPAFWREVWRVLKPGGHVVAFAGTRTYHRLACAVEDAGFEIRDMVSWLYGQGFPKSHDVSKGIDRAAGAERERIATGAPVKRMIPGADQHKSGWEKNDGRDYVPGIELPATEAARRWTGWGTALKPACEPMVLARKPLIGTVAANVLAHGTGALNVDACRVGFTSDADRNGAVTGQGTSDRIYGGGKGLRPADLGTQAFTPKDAGRWPANVCHDGSEEVLAAFPDAPGQLAAVGPDHGAKASVNVYGDYGPRDLTVPRGDSGSAARFFYSAKADAEDRVGSKHPTVKPVDLMQWLVRLVTPPGGTVLDPFAGTGTTGEAAWREGFRAVLIEREAAYCADIARRMRLCLSGPDERARESLKARGKVAAPESLPLFGAAE